MKYPKIENETKIIRSLSRGNILAFNIIFKTYSGPLYRFAKGYLKSESESEELVQEVFTRIWEKRKTLKTELCFKSLLFTIAFNLIKKKYRKDVCHSDYLKTKVPEEPDTQTSQDISYNSLYQYITELVNKLPSRRKEIFVKSRFEGLSIKEISNELKISHKTVENQLTVALKFMRTKLKHES